MVSSIAIIIILLLNICLHTVKWFQVLLFNKQFYLPAVICLNTVKWSNSSSWPIDGTQSGTTTLGQSGPESNGNEGVFHIFQSSRTGASPWDSFVTYPRYLMRRGVLTICRDAVSVIYSPSQMVWVSVLILYHAHKHTWVYIHIISCPEYNSKLHLMLRLQFYRSGESGVSSDCHYSMVHSDMEW